MNIRDPMQAYVQDKIVKSTIILLATQQLLLLVKMSARFSFATFFI